MITSSLAASPVERLVRPPKRSGLSIPRIRPLLSGGSNAANHPPAGIVADESQPDAGRVHWLVRARPDVDITRSARHPQRADSAAARGLSHAPHAASNSFPP